MSLPLPDWHKCEIQDYQIILGKLQGAELAIVFFFKTSKLKTGEIFISKNSWVFVGIH